MHNSITFCLFLYQNISCFMCMQMPKLINCIFDIYLPCTTFPQRNNLLWNVKVTFEVKLLLEKVSKTTETWWVGLHQEFITMYFLYQYTYEQLLLRWCGCSILFISTIPRICNIPKPIKLQWLPRYPIEYSILLVNIFSCLGFRWMLIRSRW